MEFNVVQLSFFAQPDLPLARLDAEFAARTLLTEELRIRKHAGKTVGQLTDGYAGGLLDEKHLTEDEMVGYLAIDDVDNEDGLAYINVIRYEDRPSRAKYVLKSGDILVSNVRPERGAITLVTGRAEDALASSGFTLLRQTEAPDLDRGFLLAALRSEFTRRQLLRRNRGSMYPAVVAADVRDIWVPRPTKELEARVSGLIRKGVEAHDEFFKLNRALQQELELFLSKNIGAPPPSPVDPLTGVTVAIRSSSEFFGPSGPQRSDAEFYRSDYAEFDQRLSKSCDSFLLGKYFQASNGRSQGDPVEEIAYLRQSILTNVGINWSAVSMEPGSPAPSRGRVKTGDILLACTAHEIYYVARKVDFVRRVPKSILENNVCVADIMILKQRSTKPPWLHGSYVAAFLRSAWGLHQVQRCIRGLRGGHVYGVDLERFVRIPLPAAPWLEEFGKNARDAESRRNRGKEFILEAVKLVDDWIGELA